MFGELTQREEFRVHAKSIDTFVARKAVRVQASRILTPRHAYSRLIQNGIRPPATNVLDRIQHYLVHLSRGNPL